MEINNEIRRLKTKLKLFEEEGLYWVLSDLIIDMCSMELSVEEIASVIRQQKESYLKQLEKLSAPNNKQGKLDI